MRRILAVLACVGIITSAQAQVITGAMFLPSPVGVVLSIGQWIIFETERTYYIEVLGEGRTAEEAKLNGFKIAVEQAVGSIIAAETEVQNNRITRDEIISYAAGYVTKFEIVNQEAGGLGVKTTMKVWIKKSNLANRLLNEGSKPADIEGQKAAAQLATLQYERAQGDRLVATVVNDFYRLGFDLEIKPVTVAFDNNRNGVVTVPFLLTWNRNYLKSLWEALKATSQESNPEACWQLILGGKCAPPASMISISTGGFMGGSGGRLGYGDKNKMNNILNVMVGSQPQVKMTIYNQQNVPWYTACYAWDMLDHNSGFNVQGARYFVDSRFYGPPNVVIDGNAELKGNIAVTMNPNQLANAGKVELKVIPSSQCPK
jgi:hypothetical protein